MANWRDSFERINSELDITKKKKQTLDGLHDSGRISQFAFECLKKGLTEEIEWVETQRKVLTERMSRKLNELEEQRVALEMFFASTEMAYVAGEINEETHTKEISALDLGLEATKQELNWIKESVIQLVPKEGEPASTVPSVAEAAEATSTEAPAERTNETTSNVPLEVPVEVPPTTGEVKVELIQVPSETPSTTQTTTSERGDAPFREQSENPTT